MSKSSAEQIIMEAIGQYKPYKYVLMVSGGHDSVTAAHITASVLKVNNIEFEIYHGDTTIGIPETQEYVKRICERYGWKLNIRRPPDPNWWYDKIVERFGFPGPTKTSHRYMYRYLKERALNRFVTYECKTHPLKKQNVFLATGIRLQESKIRMGYSKPSIKDRSKIWVAPILHFSEQDCKDYMAEHLIPPNPVKQKICISGECLCGCFARNEEWMEIKSSYPETADRIEKLWEVAKKNGFPWHWASGPNEWKKLQRIVDQQTNFMCVGCDSKY